MSRYLESERGSSSAFNLYDELGSSLNDIDDGAGSTSGESTGCVKTYTPIDLKDFGKISNSAHN